jgi:crotonobetainyl-CoA:carnitine CoA-transferase CaiB-like acyl-CoA transferase
MQLDSLVVVELGSSVAAPYAGQILADLGATVVKVEKAAGDDARNWGPPFWEGAGAMFQALNRGKQSVVCDFSDPAQMQALKAFIQERADVVLQNLRPGQMARLGLDADALRASKPGLVYCNMGAFGHKGPLSSLPGYDPLMQAYCGVMSVTGVPGDPPVRVGSSIVDMGTGMWAVIGVLTALVRRAASGEGGVVDVSLFETASAVVSLQAAQYLASGQVPGRHGSGIAGIVPYKAYRAADGDLVVAAGNDDLFRRMAGAMGLPELLSDARYGSNPERVQHKAALYETLDAAFLRRSRMDWKAAFDQAGVPCALVQDIAELLASPQMAAMGLLQPLPDSQMKMIGLPVSFDGVRPQPRSRPPTLGEHTQSVLQEAGRGV